jgi:catechol 2,3-dioxygenase-like lactoylglutathione lyase family enzyme
MRAQPMIGVRDVEASSRWYQKLLGAESGHGGKEYEQIVRGGEMLLQLHAWDAHEHPHLGNEALPSRGNGVLLWFQTEEFDAAVERARSLNAETLEAPHVNPRANHREVWLRDPDGYTIVLASAYGDVA